MPNISTQDRTLREINARIEAFKSNILHLEKTKELLMSGDAAVEPVTVAKSASTATQSKRRSRRTASRQRIAAPTTGKRKPGRPRGSKNKPKAPAITEQPTASAPAPEGTQTAQGNGESETWAGTP